MIKKLIILAMLPVMSASAAVLDNTYIGAEIGATINKSFPLNSQFGIKIGKNFSPVFGLNIEGIASFGRHHKVVHATNVGLNGTIDMFNLCSGYNPKRVFTIIPEIGMGWFHRFDDKTDQITAKTGVQAAFNIKDAWQLYVEPVIYWGLDNDQFNWNNKQIGIQVGFIYRFKTSNGTHNFVQYDIEAMNEEINSLRAKLAEKPTVITKEIPVVKEVTIVKNVSDVVVMFAKESYDLTENSKKQLDKVTGTVQVYGYASPEGSEEFNQDLSQKRADAVTEYLMSKGINVTKSMGCGVDGISSNRVVIVKHEVR